MEEITVLDGRRIEVCIPYGRARTVSILLNYLRRDRNIVDRVNLWLNTDPDQSADVAWATEQERIFHGWVRIVQNPTTVRLRPKQLNTGFFYARATQPNTLYFRFDDDIVYVHPRYFAEQVAFREAHPEALLVMGSIVNNAVCSWVFQQRGILGREHGTVASPYCMDPVGWADAGFGIALHGRFLDDAFAGRVDRWLYAEPHVLADATRFSISNFLWTGEQAASWGGPTPNRDEEIFLTEEWPRQQRRWNVINGMALVAHYSFFTQRALDGTDVLDRYRRLSERELSHSYYRLLGEAAG